MKLSRHPSPLSLNLIGLCLLVWKTQHRLKKKFAMYYFIGIAILILEADARNDFSLYTAVWPLNTSDQAPDPNIIINIYLLDHITF